MLYRKWQGLPSVWFFSEPHVWPGASPGVWQLEFLPSCPGRRKSGSLSGPGFSQMEKGDLMWASQFGSCPQHCVWTVRTTSVCVPCQDHWDWKEWPRSGSVWSVVGAALYLIGQSQDVGGVRPGSPGLARLVFCCYFLFLFFKNCILNQGHAYWF